MDFVHLHVNTEYSLLRSAAKVEALVTRAKELQFTAIAMTDQNVMYGAIPFYKACIREGIKPIIGLELCVASAQDEETWLILLAKSELGYQNLMKLSSISQIVGTKKTKQIEKKHLFSYCEDLVVISSPDKGEVQQLIINGKTDLALQVMKEYQNYFGDDFYLGIQDHGDALEKQLNIALIQLSKKYHMNLVATNQVMYVRKEDALAQKCLLAIDQGTTLQELKTEFQTEEYYLKSQQEMHQLFSQIPEALVNTKQIANKCQVTFQFGDHTLPEFPLPPTENAKDYLAKVCQEGLKNRYVIVTDQIQERLSYELQVIDQMQFNDYFLIVWDFMKFAHDNKMITGPGRGSAAGSLVAYVLNITNVDPIKYELLFERFLNPERITMPDIDIDFPDTRREEVINYVYQKYGKNHVAQIITFGTLAAKAALRDIGKVIGIPLKQIDSIAKQISSRPNLTIDEAVGESPFLQRLLSENKEN